MTTIDHEVHEIGSALVNHAAEAENFTAQRGLVDQLFPYIYQASRRMSTRAISQFLKDNFKVKLSAVTIAKALRQQDGYWLDLYESVEPAARIFADAHNMDVEDVLELEVGLFEHLKDQPPTLAMGKEIIAEKFYEYEGAVHTLRSEWFVFDEDCRKTCLASIPRDSEEEPKADSQISQ